ncbi:MAG: hypothetical protein WC979_06995 [Candidatus Pacearchaeota archaeon]|jgi:hypothetical protein
MATKCSENCDIVCDFCIYLSPKKKPFDNSGEGFCKIKKKIVNWSSGCDEFYCSRAIGDGKKNL